ncbi:unnamed protein product [Prorocentrum cordatum]|uniref:Uncharacterized protein n=1 Tax=Prorocentrum cordatum TaxID=2364126 RepID=A0ABN9THW5_9DINO|nr:unnamed protein product [Polarella glacialis]
MRPCEELFNRFSKFVSEFDGMGFHQERGSSCWGDLAENSRFQDVGGAGPASFPEPFVSLPRAAGSEIQAVPDDVQWNFSRSELHRLIYYGVDVVAAFRGNRARSFLLGSGIQQTYSLLGIFICVGVRPSPPISE